jgi:hypothetical protein
MVDIDGTFEYSRVVNANWNLDRPVNIYPNPVSNRSFKIQLNDRLTCPAVVQLCDQMGSSVWQFQLDDPFTEVILPDTVRPGVYFARFTSSSGYEIISIVVQ